VVAGRLAGRNIRHQLPGFAASFIALVLATLVVTVCGGLLETGLRSDVPAQRLAAAPVLVTGVQGYDGAALTERDRLGRGPVSVIAALPGVARTVDDVSVPVTVLHGGSPAGLPAIAAHDWSAARLTPFRLISGRAPTAAGDVVIDRRTAARLHLAAGRPLRVLARGSVVALRVSGIAAAASAQAPALFVTDARAQALLGRPGQVDTVAVYPDRGVPASRLARRITAALPAGTALVLTGAERGRAEFPGAAAQSTGLIPLAAASGGIMAVVAIFIVASTLALSVRLRRRQIALLRAVGATPGQLRRLVLSETLLLAVPAAGLGLLPARAVGGRLLAALASHGLAAGRLVYHQGLIPAASGAAIAILTGLAAALVAAREAIATRPVEALADDTGPPRRLSRARLAFGLLTLAGAAALALVTALAFDGPVAASTAAPSALLWALSLALLAPVLTRPWLRLAGAAAAVLAPRTGHVAMITIRGGGARTAAMITPVMLATGLTSALLYLQTSQQAATGHAYARQLSADLVASAPGGLPLSAAARLSRMPGVAAASPLVTSDGFFNLPRGSDDDDADAIPLQGLDGAAASEVTRYPVTAGRLSRLRGDTIAIPAAYRERGRDLGDAVTLRFGDNAVRRLTVVAVFTAPRGYPVLLLPAGLLAAHTATGLAGQVLVRTDGRADPAALQRALRVIVPGARVAGRPASLAAFSAQQQTGAWVSYLLVAALLAYTTIALVNATVAAAAGRRRPLRLLRLAGASRGQVARGMTIDAVVISGTGIALGTLLALATLLPFDSALGAPGLPAGSPWIYLTVAGAAALLTAGVTWLATRLVNTDPATQSAAVMR
jgi:putative ABC transport system permease protein